MKQLVSCFFIMSLLACSNEQQPVQTDNNKAYTADAYPVSFFFRQQIKEVDSLKLPTTKFTELGNTRDTVAISLEEFKALAKEFSDVDITDPSVRKHYKESNFADQSIPSITLNYSTNNTDLAIQRIDVILDPNPVADDQVKTIYIEKKARIGDTLILKKLYWKSHKNFQVLTMKMPVGNKQIISQVKVAWDNSDQF